MKNNEQQEAYEKLMSANHGRMIDFVKFAETKNAALLTFCSVWMAAIVTLLKASEELPMGYGYAFQATLPLLFIAAAICLKSLLPLFLDQVHELESDYPNLLYFGDIAKGGVKNYSRMAEELYMPMKDQLASPAYLQDLAVQTAIQASIAHRKFQMFKWSGTLVLLAFLCMAVPPLSFCAKWVISLLHC